MDEQEHNKIIYRNYVEHLTQYRKEIHEGKIKAIENYDKLIIQIAIATIGVSVIFLEKIAGNAPYNSTYWLYISWIAGSLTILTTIYNHLISYFSHSSELDETDELIQEYNSKILELEYAPAVRKADSRLKEFLNWLIDKLNPFSGLLLFVSLSSLLIFSAANFEREPVMSEKQNSPQPNSVRPANRPAEPQIVRPQSKPADATEKRGK